MARHPDASAEQPADAVATWRTHHPTAIVLTLATLRRGGPDPTHRVVSDHALWKTTLTVDGPATMLLTQSDLHTLTCRAWGPGAHAAADAAPDLCGERDDPTGFEPRHAVLHEIHRRNPGLRIPRTGRVLEALVPAIIEQRVVGLQATAAWRHLVHAFGTPAPGPAPPGMKVVPSPAAWAGIRSWEWHHAGVDPGRARTITACARGAVRLEEITWLPPDEATARLRAVPGVGGWTAAEVAQRALGDADTLSIGDHHLAAVVGEVLFGRVFDDAAIVAALRPWRPHRYRVVRLLETAGYYSRRRHGPRARFVDHRDR